MNMLPYSGFPALPDKMEDMHKQLVALGLNDVEALTARIKKCEDWVDNVEETELTGNPVTFNNALALPAKSLTTSIEPIQDLHGYDHPWAGGAGKNKVPFFTSSTVSGRVWTVSDDGIVTITGESTGYSYKVMNITLPAGTYQLSGGDPSGVSGTGDEYVQVDGTVVARSYGSTNQTFTLSEEKTVVLALRDFQTAGSSATRVFKPMICLSSAPNPLVYEPYSNICPISGRTEARVDTENEDSSESAYAVIQLGQTVYGADINWDTGVMTVKTAVVDIGNISYSYRSSLGQFYTGDALTDGAGNIAGGRDGKCSIYKIEHPTDTTSISDGATTFLNSNYGVGKTIWIKDSRFTNPADLKTALSGQTLVYPLATPTTIQLTPTQLQMLKGYNRVSIEDGSIEITAYTGAAWEAVTRAIKKVTNKTKTTKKRRK